jgi:2-polyprenyl-3-methyl-5-hydroxy-6-metoxy-1,4-benzoquinol methylase
MNPFESGYSPLVWEEVECAWCGSTLYDICFEGPDRLERLPGKFRLVRCSQCGLYRQNPRLVWSSLQKYYPEEYKAYAYRDEKTRSWRQYIENYGNNKRCKAIHRYINGGSILEVGCGTGGFIQELIRSGNWVVSGIEPNQKAAEFTQKKTDATIYPCRFSDVEFEPGSFDAIVLWTVLEHLDQPIKDLQYAYRLLRKNGWLFFSIPNVESLNLKIFKKYWSGWDIPRHLHIFPRSTLHEILHQIGFSIVDERCISTSYQALGHNLEFWSQEWEGKYPRLKKICKAVYYSWLTRMILLMPLAILDRLNLTDTITYFVQKR